MAYVGNPFSEAFIVWAFEARIDKGHIDFTPAGFTVLSIDVMAAGHRTMCKRGSGKGAAYKELRAEIWRLSSLETSTREEAYHYSIGKRKLVTIAGARDGRV